MLIIMPVMATVLDTLFNNLVGIFGGIGAILMAVAVWLARKYLVPYLAVERHRRYAEYIALIADDVTDDLIARYPDNAWLKRLDEAVDKVIEICGIEDEVAQRAVSAAITRK